MKFDVRLKSAMALALSLAVMGAIPARAAQTAEGAPLHLAMTYDGSLYVKVLDVSVNQTIEPHAFTADAHIKTSGLLALFRKINLKAQSEGRIEAGVAQPHQFSYLNTDGHKNRHVSAAWSATDVTTESQPHFPNMGDPPATKEQKLEAADPLTILTRIALLPPGERPCQGVNQFFDGKQRYDLEYSFRGATQPDGRERRLGLVSTVRCTVAYREVAGFNKKPPEKRNQGIHREVLIGLGRVGANGPWVVSFLHADTFLGAAEIDLNHLVMTGQKP